MKSDDIRRGVQRGVSLRKTGSAPDIGKVDRMHRVIRKERRRHGEAKNSGDKTREKRERVRRLITTGWSIAVAVMAAGVLVAAFLFWLRPMLQREKDTTERDRLAAETRAKKASRYKSPGEDEAMEIVTHALAVRTPMEAREWIRLGSATAAEVVDYLQTLATREGTPVEKILGGCIDKNGLQLEGIEVVYGAGEFDKRRLAILTPDEHGVWKMDFAAFARSVNPSWSEFMKDGENRHSDGDVRVYFTKDRYFNGPFIDEKKWQAYGLVSQDLKDQLLVGYCKRGTPQHQAMELMLAAAGGRPALRTTLSVRHVPGAENRQLEITRVLAEDWVLADQPFDEQF
ncbi:MAG: hypothetical protein K9N23_23215 [Akkermansiaceae bacterium]|nr:hypothetical protein [Akkermansiaceae bacterium]